MYCHKCGSFIEEGENFCGNCGTPVTIKTIDTLGILVCKAKQNDSDAMAELYNQTYSQVFYVVKSMIKDEDTVYDIIQDTYLKAFAHLDSFSGEYKFLPWVKQIAANTARDHLKKKRPTLFTDLGNPSDAFGFEDMIEDDQTMHMPEVVIDRQETARLLREIIDELPEDQRAAIGMYYYEELSVKQISETFGVSESAIKSRLMYGRKKIESKVRELEKKGTKLYSIAPFAFFLLLLNKQKAMAFELTPDPRILQYLLKTTRLQMPGNDNPHKADTASSAYTSGQSSRTGGHTTGTHSPGSSSTAASSGPYPKDTAQAAGKTAGKAAAGAGKAAVSGKAAAGGIGIAKIIGIVAAVIVLGGGSFFVTTKIIEKKPASEPTVNLADEIPVQTDSIIPETETRKELSEEEMIDEAMALYQKIIDQADSYDYHILSGEPSSEYLYAFVTMTKADKVPALLLKRGTNDGQYYVKFFDYEEETGEVHEASESLQEKTTLLQRMNDGEGVAYTNFVQGTGEMSISKVLLNDGEITITEEYTGNVMDDMPASLGRSDIKWYDASKSDGIEHWAADTAPVTQSASSSGNNSSTSPAATQTPGSGAATDGDRTVLTGTVKVCDYYDLVDLEGGDPNHYVYETTTVLIILDTPQSLSCMSGDPSNQTLKTKDAWCIEVSDSAAGDFYGLDGEHIVFSIDPYNTYLPSDVHMPVGQPKTKDIHIL